MSRSLWLPARLKVFWIGAAHVSLGKGNSPDAYGSEKNGVCFSDIGDYSLAPGNVSFKADSLDLEL